MPHPNEVDLIGWLHGVWCAPSSAPAPRWGVGGKETKGIRYLPTHMIPRRDALWSVQVGPERAFFAPETV